MNGKSRCAAGFTRPKIERYWGGMAMVAFISAVVHAELPTFLLIPAFRSFVTKAIATIALIDI
jgi:hypothetical protein